MDTATVQQLVPQLFAIITRQLEAAAPGIPDYRKFTIDCCRLSVAAADPS